MLNYFEDSLHVQYNFISNTVFCDALLHVRKLPRATTNVQKNKSYVVSYVGLFISYVGLIKSYVGLYNSYVGDKISQLALLCPT